MKFLNNYSTNDLSERKRKISNLKEKMLSNRTYNIDGANDMTINRKP